MKLQELLDVLAVETDVKLALGDRACIRFTWTPFIELKPIWNKVELLMQYTVTYVCWEDPSHVRIDIEQRESREELIRQLRQYQEAVEDWKEQLGVVKNKKDTIAEGSIKDNIVFLKTERNIILKKLEEL